VRLIRNVGKLNIKQELKLRGRMSQDTDTVLKLRDAATQMKLALKHPEDDDIFRSCINSYISNARSVTFVMQKESSSIPGLTEWYEKQMDNLKKLPLLKFFNENRNHTIHRGVVKPNKKSAEAFNIKAGGVPVPGSAKVSYWLFEGIEKYRPKDSGNVLRLCEEYFLIMLIPLGQVIVLIR